VLALAPYRVGLQHDINLAHSTHLRHINLLLYPHQPVAFTLLSQITLLPVEHLSLAIFDYHDVDWARLDRLLTQHQWANLQRLSVRKIGGMIAEVRNLIRSRLPTLESHGVVLDLV
jgi:hypothetical protein